MHYLFLFTGVCLFLETLGAQQVWKISDQERDIQIDGFTDDWQGVPALTLSPESSGLRVTGEFEADDVKVGLRGLWNRDNLYIAVHWQDNIWDITQVTRREAVWVTPDRRRRDRMLFFDYLKFHIREADYDFTFWLTPRMDDRGPFQWHRLLEGLKGMERASTSPVITGRYGDEGATLEIMLSWRELKIKPKPGTQIPLVLILADSDLLGTALEFKLDRLKSLEWQGRLVLEGVPR